MSAVLHISAYSVFNRLVLTFISEVEVGSSLLDNITGDSIRVALEVLGELFSQRQGSSLVLVLCGPAVDRSQDVTVDTHTLLGDHQVEATHVLELTHVEGIVMDRVNDGAGLGE